MDFRTCYVVSDSSDTNRGRVNINPKQTTKRWSPWKQGTKLSQKLLYFHVITTLTHMVETACTSTGHCGEHGTCTLMFIYSYYRSIKGIFHGTSVAVQRVSAILYFCKNDNLTEKKEPTTGYRNFRCTQRQKCIQRWYKVSLDVPNISWILKKLKCVQYALVILRVIPTQNHPKINPIFIFL